MVIQYPFHIQDILDRYSCKVKLRNTTHASLRESRNKVLESLATDADINNMGAEFKTAELQNKIEEADLGIQ